MDTYAALDRVREMLADPTRWLKYLEATIPANERQGRADLYRACRAVAPDNAAIYVALSIAIRQTFPDRTGSQHCGTRPDFVLDVIDFNNHKDTRHGDVVTVLAIARRLELPPSRLEDEARKVRLLQLKLGGMRDFFERRGYHFTRSFARRPLAVQLRIVEEMLGPRLGLHEVGNDGADRNADREAGQ